MDRGREGEPRARPLGPAAGQARAGCLAATLQVVEEDGRWSTGHGRPGLAAVPDLVNPALSARPTPSTRCASPSCSARTWPSICSAPPREYRHENVGTVASLGMHQGVAQMFGRFKVRGLLAWVLHRTYHLYAMPTLNRKFRIASGWTATLLFRREVVALGTLHDPRAEFRAAAVPPSRAQDEAADAADPEIEAATQQAADEG